MNLIKSYNMYSSGLLQFSIIKILVIFNINIFNINIIVLQDPKPAPFQTIRLSSSAEASLHNLVWHPENALVFAACVSDGSVIVCEVGADGKTYSIVGNVPETAAATASRLFSE